MKDHSLDIIKKKSSSGCLIIKKKVPLDSSSNSSKKRPRLTDDVDDPFPPREIDNFRYTNRGFNGELETTQKGEFDESGSRESRKIKKHRHWQNDDRRDSGSGGSSSRVVYDDNPRRDFRPFSSRYDGESYVPVSDRQQVVYDKPIRLQGKNGVLKVMVKKNQYNHPISQSYDPPPQPVKDWEESRPPLYKIKQPRNEYHNDHHWEATAGSSSYSASKHHGKPVSVKSKQKSEIELMNVDTHTPLPVKSSSRVVNSSTENRIQTKTVTPVQGSEPKVVKRGTGTEKQLLREKIRSMLLSAGWTIDYRPRRNRDYLDAVYINPSGTAFWSIIKAYEALQKEEKQHSQVGAPVDFTPLPVETLSKLTRQTRKKIERDLKKKSRDESKSLVDIQIDSDYRETPQNTTFGMVQAQKSNKLGRCTLLIRRSQGEKSENDLFVPYSGKRTLLSWLIDSGTVQMGEKVQYMNHENSQVMQEGWITKEGIKCGCCSKILTVLKFELHAGSKLRDPFSNIFVQSGQSLMQCLIDAWNKQGELQRKGFHAVNIDGEDPNDDTCGLCADGGDLICCDGCPSTFHQNCLGIQMLPQGDWHCPNCSCKYCQMVTESPLHVCCLCEKKYHESCSLDMDEKPADPNLFFCGPKCLEVYSQLQNIIGVKNELDSGFSWSLIHRSDVSSDTSSSLELSQRVESNSKLAVAMSVIDECFLPIADRRSGINLIQNVVYNCGSNLSRLNYSGFLTAILEREDEMICAASIRIHGTQLAEMPFIGTRHIYRRQGMCRRLLSAIESVLSSLHIEKLVIPAIAEHMHTWTGVFGFSPLDESHKQERRSINMLIFPGTDMLHKPLQKGSLLQKTSANMCKRPGIEKSEANSPDDEEEFIQSIAPTDPASQAPGISMDDGCSIDPLEKRSPLQKMNVEMSKRPEIEKSEANSPDDEEEFIESITPTDPASQDPCVSMDDGCSIDPLEKPSPLQKKNAEMSKRPEIEKSEANSPGGEELIESIAPTESASQVPSVSLDDGCSIDPNISRTYMLHKPLETGSPLEKPSMEMCKMPEIEKSEASSPDDKKFIESIAPTESASQAPNVSKDDGCSVDPNISVENNNPLEVACNSTLQFDGDDTIMQNGEESTENNVHADAIATKIGDTNGDSKEEGCAVVSLSSPKTVDATQDPDFVLSDVKTLDNPLLPKELESASKMEESVDLLTVKESISVPADSDFNLQVVDDKTEAGVLNDVISSDIPCEPEQQLSEQANTPGIGETITSF